MDFKERLARMEERRGETIDETLAKHYKETGLTVNDHMLGFAEALAKANTDETAEILDLMGSLEHYRPYESIGDMPFFFTGMESVSDTIVRIFDRIIAFIKRWIKVLADAELKLSLQTALHHHSLENIRTNLRTTSRKPTNRPTFGVFTRVANLSVNYRPIKDATGLLNALTVLRTVADGYFTGHSAQVLGRVNQVVRAVNENKPAEYLASLMKEVSPVSTGRASYMCINAEEFVSPHLMGNHRFVVTASNKHSSSPVDNVNGTRVKLAPSQLTPVESPSGIEFAYFDMGLTEAVLTKCDSILSILSNSNNGQGRHARRQALAALLSSVERINADIQRNGLTSEDEARETISVLESYISWIADPYPAFYAYVLRNVRAVLNVCESNIT